MDAVVSERRRPEGADTTSATGGVSSSLGIGFFYFNLTLSVIIQSVHQT